MKIDVITWRGKEKEGTSCSNGRNTSIREDDKTNDIEQMKRMLESPNKY